MATSSLFEELLKGDYSCPKCKEIWKGSPDMGDECLTCLITSSFANLRGLDGSPGKKTPSSQVKKTTSSQSKATTSSQDKKTSSSQGKKTTSLQGKRTTSFGGKNEDNEFREYHCPKCKQIWWSLNCAVKGDECSKCKIKVQEFKGGYKMAWPKFQRFGEHQCPKCKQKLKIGHECTKCKIKVHPRKQSDDTSERQFGEFKCLRCKKEWKSGNTWDDMGQECGKCGILVYPHTKTDLQRKPASETTGEHPMHLCEMCRRLGKSCQGKDKRILLC